jgi:hypothetical protein
MRHFGFMDGPTDISALDLSAGISFQNGLLGKQVVLDLLRIHHDGVVAQCKDGTESCDNAIEELIAMGIDCGLVFESARGTSYFSALVAYLDIDLETRFKPLQPVMDDLNAALRDAGLLTEDFEAFSLQLWANKTSRPHFFKLEKRVGQPGAFYSTAPMQTQAHLDLLGKLEAIV